MTIARSAPTYRMMLAPSFQVSPGHVSSREIPRTVPARPESREFVLPLVFGVAMVALLGMLYAIVLSGLAEFGATALKSIF